MQGDVMYRFRGLNPNLFILYINKNGPSIFLKKKIFPVLSGHDFS